MPNIHPAIAARIARTTPQAGGYFAALDEAMRNALAKRTV
jgi:hypothetical protein